MLNILLWLGIRDVRYLHLYRYLRLFWITTTRYDFRIVTYRGNRSNEIPRIWQLWQRKERGFQSVEVWHCFPLNPERDALFEDFPCTQRKNVIVTYGFDPILKYQILNYRLFGRMILAYTRTYISNLNQYNHRILLIAELQ